MKPHVDAAKFPARWRQLSSLTAATTLLPFSAPAIVFNLIPEPGMPQYAIDGFNAAASVWSSVLTDNVTINIQIGYASLGPNIIGETTSSFIEASYASTLDALASRRTSADDYSSYAALQQGSSFTRLINHTIDNPNGPNSATPYFDTMDRIGLTTANAKVLGLLEQDSSIDAVIRFSSDFEFDFNNGPSINFWQMDFIGVAAHEIGHALGFASGVDDIDYFHGQYPGGEFSSNLIDLFRFSQLSLSYGPGIPDYTADNRDKFFSTDGGETELALFSNGLNYGDERQASHWKDDLGIGLLDPSADYGEKLKLTQMELRVFDVMGFTIIPEPAHGALFALGFLAFGLHRFRRTR